MCLSHMDKEATTCMAYGLLHAGNLGEFCYRRMVEFTYKPNENRIERSRRFSKKSFYHLRYCKVYSYIILRLAELETRSH